MRMTSPEKLILENQMQIMMALSLLLQHQRENFAAVAVSRQISKTTVVLQEAKTWPEE